jgi:glycosyltransferase involved in cell wall biosynthesis
MKRKKILIIIDSLGVGGSQENVLNFVNNMMEYDVTVLSCYSDDYYSKKFKNVGAEVVFLSRVKGSQLKKLICIPIVFIKFLFFKINHFDLIILRLPFTLLMASIFTLYKRKNVIFDVDCTFYQLNYFEKKIFEIYLNKYKFILLPIVIRESFKSISFNSSRLYDDIAFVNERNSKNPIVFKKKYNLLFISRLIPQKGLRIAIEIIVKYNISYGDTVDLHVIGDGVDLMKNKEFCENNNISFVKFYGFVTNLDDYIENCDAFIKTSYNEPINSTAREFMQKGKIVFTIIDVLDDKVFLDKNLIHEILRSDYDYSIRKINKVLSSINRKDVELISKNFSELYGNKKAKEFYIKLFSDLNFI